MRLKPSYTLRNHIKHNESTNLSPNLLPRSTHFKSSSMTNAAQSSTSAPPSPSNSLFESGVNSNYSSINSDLQHGYSTRKRKINFKFDNEAKDSHDKPFSPSDKFQKKSRSSLLLASSVPLKTKAFIGRDRTKQSGSSTVSNIRLTQNFDDHDTFCYYCDKSFSYNISTTPPANSDNNLCTPKSATPRDNCRCSYCTKSYHLNCLPRHFPVPSQSELVENNWMCPSCCSYEIPRRNQFKISDLRGIFRHHLAKIGHPLVSEGCEDDKQISELPIGCGICGLTSGQHNVAVICDCCDREFHLRCLKIDQIPFGDWFCPDCLKFDVCTTCIIRAWRSIELSSLNNLLSSPTSNTPVIPPLINDEIPLEIPHQETLQDLSENIEYFMHIGSNKNDINIVQCMQCLLKFHPSCVGNACCLHQQQNNNPKFPNSSFTFSNSSSITNTPDSNFQSNTSQSNFNLDSSNRLQNLQSTNTTNFHTNHYDNSIVLGPNQESTNKNVLYPLKQHSETLLDSITPPDAYTNNMTSHSWDFSKEPNNEYDFTARETLNKSSETFNSISNSHQNYKLRDNEERRNDTSNSLENDERDSYSHRYRSTNPEKRLIRERGVDYNPGNAWLCPICQEINGISRILYQRYCNNSSNGTTQLQALCKFKNISYRNVFWVPSERVKALNINMWKKWETYSEANFAALADEVSTHFSIDDYDTTSEDNYEAITTFPSHSLHNSQDAISNTPDSNSFRNPPDSPEPLRPDFLTTRTTFRCPPNIKIDLLQIDRILDERRCVRGTGQLQYLIKWKSQPYDDFSWEPAIIANDTPALLLYKNIQYLLHSTLNKNKFFTPQSFPSHNKDFQIESNLPEGYCLKKGTKFIVETAYQKSIYDSPREATSNFEPNQSISSEFFWKPSETQTSGLSEESEEGSLDKLRREFRKGKFISYRDKLSVLNGNFLYDYQLEGINWMIYSWHKRTSIILADEMGLGKTVQLINFMSILWNDHGVQGPFLIIAPLATLEDVWLREFNNWAPFINVVPYFGNPISREICRTYEFYYKHQFSHIQLTQWYSNSNHKDQIYPEYNRETIRARLPKLYGQKLLKFDVLLTSYELFKKDSSHFSTIQWKCIVIDEGHRLKSWNSELKRLLDGFTAEQRILLTGTPLQNTLDELFSLLNFLHPEKFPENRKEVLLDITEEKTIELLKKELQPHILRRIKKNVLPGKIPKKTEQIILVENTKTQKEFYKNIYLRNKDALQGKTSKQLRVNSLKNVMMQLRKCCNHPYLFEPSCPPCTNDREFSSMLTTSGKLHLLHRMLAMLKKKNHRVLIFSQFMRMLDILEEYLLYAGYGYERLDGSTSASCRQQAIDRFNSKLDMKFVFLLSTKAGGLGINLTSADTVVIFDSDWNPHNDLQAQARAHRLGQKKRVAIFRFVTRATVEERIVKIARNKLLLDQVIAGRVKPKEVEFILKAGAAELFSKGSEDKTIYYDDAQLETILDRGGDISEKREDHHHSPISNNSHNKSLLESEDSESDVEGGGVLDSFKVAHYETIDKQELSSEDNDDEFKGFWQDLIGDVNLPDEMSNNSFILDPYKENENNSGKRYGRGCRSIEKASKAVHSTPFVTKAQPEQSNSVEEKKVVVLKPLSPDSSYPTTNKTASEGSVCSSIQLTNLQNSEKEELSNLDLDNCDETESQSIDQQALQQTTPSLPNSPKKRSKNSKKPSFTSTSNNSPTMICNEDPCASDSLDKSSPKESSISISTTYPPSTTSILETHSIPRLGYISGPHSTTWDLDWLAKLVDLQRHNQFTHPIMIENSGLCFLLSSALVNNKLKEDCDSPYTEEQTLSYLRLLSKDELHGWSQRL